MNREQEIRKVCALSRLNAPETEEEHHAYSTARETLSSLVERVIGRAPVDVPRAAPEEGPRPAEEPGCRLREDAPPADARPPGPEEVGALGPERREGLLLVPRVL